MPTYLLLTTLTPQGCATLHADPDRALAVNKEIEGFGCKILAQYSLLGPYDFMTLVEAEDNETVSHLSVDLASRGTMKMQSFPASSMEDLIANLKGRAQIGRQD